MNSKTVTKTTEAVISTANNKSTRTHWDTARRCAIRQEPLKHTSKRATNHRHRTYLAAVMERQMNSLILLSVSPIFDRRSGNCLTMWHPLFTSVLHKIMPPSKSEATVRNTYCEQLKQPAGDQRRAQRRVIRSFCLMCASVPRKRVSILVEIDAYRVCAQ